MRTRMDVVSGFYYQTCSMIHRTADQRVPSRFAAGARRQRELGRLRNDRLARVMRAWLRTI